MGTIIVKPKQKEHFIELTENGFTPGNLLDSVQRQFGYCCLAPICSLANHKTIYNQRTNNSNHGTMWNSKSATSILVLLTEVWRLSISS